MNENLKGEIALIILLGFTGLKTSPYFKAYNEKFGISKEHYKQLKSMSINELSARYSFMENKINGKE